MPKPPCLSSLASGSSAHLSADIHLELLPRAPRLLLLVNPFGGRGLAWQWCKNHVLPIISEAGLSFNIIQTGKAPGGRAWQGKLGGPERLGWQTPPQLNLPIPLERQNHARELVQSLNLSEWDGIVTVSGDGLLYEVGPKHQGIPALSPSDSESGVQDPRSAPRSLVSLPAGAKWSPGPARLGGGLEDARGDPSLRLRQCPGRSRESA